jgi:Subtilase family
MLDHPLLILPSPTKAERENLTSSLSKMHTPTPGRQLQRIGPKFELLQKSMEAESIYLRTTATGAEPEQVIVLEIVGSVENFANAVRKIDGLEWMAEWDEEEIPPDEDFFRLSKNDEEDHEKGLRGRLFLAMSNQRGMTELLSLWNRYQTNPDQPFEHGLNKFRDVFRQLKDLRRWSEQDRIVETGMLKYWKDALEHGYDPIRFEVEFWYRDDERRRAAAFEKFSAVVREAGGTCFSQCAIPQVAYHAAVVQLPPHGVQAIVELPESKVVRSNDVMFFRPLGQCTVEPPSELVDIEEIIPTNDRTPAFEPVAALLDGMPLENHPLISGMIVLDDPDGWASSYPAEDRQHGTGMASVILHGDLSAEKKTLDRVLYVRPIMQPNPHTGRRPRGECIPEGLLPADLIHRAVRRMFERVGGEKPAAPSVRIINLSLGDPSQLFDYQPSAWARVLDWLSWTYKILFIVSAGNHGREILLDSVDGGLASLEPAELERRVFQYVATDLRHRRLLTPAESINSITVGASHDDACSNVLKGNRVDLLSGSLPSLGNALGHGFQRSVKPEILMPGGRQLYREQPDRRDGKICLRPVISNQPPGIKVATPGTAMSGRFATGYSCGSSNAAGLATRAAIELFDQLLSLKSEPGGDALRGEQFAVLLKTLLIHGAGWGQNSAILEAALRIEANDPKLKARMTRFLGYGVVDLNRVLACTRHRATLIGCDNLRADEGHQYLVPLPPSLSGRTDWRRLTITLAWLTPINPQHHKYRQAHLWFDPPRESLRVSRRQAEWRASRRGTSQHEVLEGGDACVIAEDDNLKITVNCRSDAGRITEPIPYALAISLEVADQVDIAIYKEINTRLRHRIKPPGAV